MRIYIDMDDVLCDFSKAYRAAKQSSPEIAYPNSQYGFYKNLEPIFGAKDAISELNKLETYDVYILTAPSIYNPLSYTEKRIWVEEHLGFHMLNKLIISPNKSLLKGDILIDDKSQGHGQEGFEGKLIQFGSEFYPDWTSVMKELKKTF